MPADAAHRGSPDALLALAKKEGRGRLKIYLGAAPGVGKTYAMLTAARTAKVEGREVVAGLVETHGRRETELLVEGLEVLPRKPIVYRNQIMKEFDLDAALARRPSLLLVDEYAHTNVPGSRHPKRWQDIEELLAAGIDVWSTLNIQHLESLNDVVQKITHVRVRETVPDGVFENANEIILVDLPSDELLKRLAEGKVYVQDTAARAIESFFKPQNLTALRELALRRAAERIDADLIERMQAQAIEGPWAAGERILSRDRAGGQAPGRPDGRPLDCGNCGAGRQPHERRGARARRGSLEARRNAGWRDQDPHRRRHPGGAFAVRALRERHPDRGRPLAQRHPCRTVPALAAAAATLIGELLTALTPFPNLSMVFLLAVVFAAVTHGIWPAIFASVLSFLAYNFFFIEPIYTFTVAQPHELLALVIFLLIAVIASALAGRVREQAQIAVGRMRATRRLYEFTRKLSGLATIDAVLEAAAIEFNTNLGRPTVILLERGDQLEMRGSWPPEDALDTASMSAARWAFTRDEPAGADTATLPTVPWFFVPLRTPRGIVGVLGVGQIGGQPSLDPEARSLLDTLAEQTEAALERALLAREILTARTAAETERVRNTLLASISHDFRTPLSSILGSATSLIEYGDKLEPAAQKDLLGHIKQEAEGLDEMVRNLLAMTRIDAGVLELRHDWIDVREVVERVLSTARRRGAAQEFELKLPAKMPLIRADATLGEQALGNVIGNAIAHPPKETKVVVDALVDAGQLVLRVTDDGPGISPQLLPRIFDKFVRADTSGAQHADGGEGTGLGLAIAKGIIEAHGGSIAAESPVHDGRGTRVSLIFQREEEPS